MLLAVFNKDADQADKGAGLSGPVLFTLAYSRHS